MNADAAASFISACSNQADGAAQAGTHAGLIDPTFLLRGRALTLTKRLTRSRGGGVVRITDNPYQPYWVLSWKAK
jgi:hypothetical protein